MADPNPSQRSLTQEAQSHDEIEAAITALFAPEDEALRAAQEAGRQAGMPAISISPVQGRMLQVLAAACGARKMLEIGTLAGYSAIWLARALPPGGRLISLEMSERHAEVALLPGPRRAGGPRGGARGASGGPLAHAPNGGSVRSHLHRCR